jgi:ribonuclease VapC
MLNGERGGAQVEELVADGAAISTVNLSEVASKLLEAGMPLADMHDALDPLGLEAVDLDVDLAYRAGSLREATRPGGLSLADRMCLALAQRMGVPAITADRAWDSLRLDVTVHLLR